MNLSQIDALHHLVESLVERMKAKHQLIAQADQAIEQATKAKADAKAYLDEHGPKADRLFALYDQMRAEAIDHVLDNGMPESE